ncbi:hypothetical protein [Infirmifilum sp.]|uniref:hypothetical protein n=1 Tax=Infirmifilum sp. TaxID=2856575 RepID=UPI003D117E4B
MIVGLRHDIDNTYGLRKGLPKLVEIEDKLDLRSTFFVRVDVIQSREDERALRRIEDEGWEIGLHLVNTIGTPALPSPQEELERLRRVFEIHGVTPCGKTIGFKGEVTWRVMDSLGLKYMEGYGEPGFPVRTFVMPTHLSLDIYYVRRFGEKRGYSLFKADLLRMLGERGVATVLVHPEWFVRSVGGAGATKAVMTILGIKMLNNIYRTFLQEFSGVIKFMKYIDLYQVLSGR